jgi:hypothetical protein
LFFSEITNHPFSLKHSVIRSLYFILVCNSVFMFIFFDNVVVSFLHCPQTYNQNFMLQWPSYEQPHKLEPEIIEGTNLLVPSFYH